MSETKNNCTQNTIKLKNSGNETLAITIASKLVRINPGETCTFDAMYSYKLKNYPQLVPSEDETHEEVTKRYRDFGVEIITPGKSIPSSKKTRAKPKKVIK